MIRIVAGFPALASEMRCGTKSRVRSIGDVRFVLISDIMSVSEWEDVLGGSRREKALWIPALIKTASIVGCAVRISETVLDKDVKSSMSHYIAFCSDVRSFYVALIYIYVKTVGAQATLRVSKPGSSFARSASLSSRRPVMMTFLPRL